MRQDVWDRLNEAVSGQGVSRSEFVRQALEAALADKTAAVESVRELVESHAPSREEWDKLSGESLLQAAEEARTVDVEALADELGSMPGTSTAPELQRYKCPRECDPLFRPTSRTMRCNRCRSLVVPA